MRPPPFNTRIALGNASVVMLTLIVFAAAALIYFHYEQIELVDMNLQSVLDSPLEENGLPDGLPAFTTAGLFGSDGRLLAATNAFPANLARQMGTPKHPVTMISTPNNWRLQSQATVNGGTLVAAYDLQEVQEVMRESLAACLLVLPVLSAMAGVAAWRVAHHAMRPLRLLTLGTEGIAARRLDQRVPVPEALDDVRRLSQAFNAMLGRLEAGFNQAERFAANASHELRTPLTIMSGEIAQLLRTPNLAPSQELKLVSVQEEIGRLGRITEHLLLLAQFDAGKSGVERYRLLDFSALMEGLCEDAEILALARDVRLQVLLGPSPRVKGDDLLLRRLVLNLIDNATKYNVPSGEVLCELTVAGAELQLRVSNTGPSILPANREQLFRRFFRADAARGRCGHGLGLALSLEIARSHGGNLVLAPDPAPGRTQFLLTLPTAVEQA